MSSPLQRAFEELRAVSTVRTHRRAEEAPRAYWSRHVVPSYLIEKRRARVREWLKEPHSKRLSIAELAVELKVSTRTVREHVSIIGAESRGGGEK